jgi:hypothetical protein
MDQALREGGKGRKKEEREGGREGGREGMSEGRKGGRKKGGREPVTERQMLQDFTHLWQLKS